ncbi:hypothetical protein AK812_SmicGene21902 [Symbiodinium microadriaticum]|uniref:Ubiquitin-like domain-containing protein n=1 Tax=Symbiodinium microadriaticum TaxID=2951 RepID=A0A1Q9DL88_SYMMI|nr:hypothetical protein AK812_SmicGene21902 [Symbiodinium microadriaticum]
MAQISLRVSVLSGRCIYVRISPDATVREEEEEEEEEGKPTEEQLQKGIAALFTSTGRKALKPSDTLAELGLQSEADGSLRTWGSQELGGDDSSVRAWFGSVHGIGSCREVRVGGYDPKILPNKRYETSCKMFRKLLAQPVPLLPSSPTVE